MLLAFPHFLSDGLPQDVPILGRVCDRCVVAEGGPTPKASMIARFFSPSCLCEAPSAMLAQSLIGFCVEQGGAGSGGPL